MDFNARIQPFLDHYNALKEHDKLENALQSFVTLLHPDNRAYLLETPFKALVERNLERDDPQLFEWYIWFVFESSEGRRGLPGWDNEFTFDDQPFSRTYRASEFAENLTGFFRVVVPHLDEIE